MTSALIVAAVCLLLEAFFSGSEIAVVASDRLKIRRGVEESREAVGRRVEQDTGCAVRSQPGHDRRGPAEAAAAGRHDAGGPPTPRGFLVKRRDSLRRADGETAGADADDQG